MILRKFALVLIFILTFSLEPTVQLSQKSIIGAPADKFSQLLSIKGGHVEDHHSSTHADFGCDGEHEKRGVVSRGFSTLVASVPLLYGIGLLLYGSACPNQIYLITMMRATGYGKVEKAVARMKQNFRDALKKAILNAPSLIMAAKAVSGFDNRIRQQKAIIKESKKAMEDGTIDKKEAKKIDKMRRKQLKHLKKDLTRYKRGLSVLWMIWHALDFDEILDILKNLVFMAAMVLAAGHEESKIGTVIIYYCTFQNLGQLLAYSAKRSDYLLTHTILNMLAGDDEEEQAKAHNMKKVERVSKGIFYTVAAAMVLAHFDSAMGLNSVLTSATLILRGLVGFAAAITGHASPADQRAGVGAMAGAKGPLSGRWGGLLYLALACVGVYRYGDWAGDAELGEAAALPLEWAEEYVSKIVVFVSDYL